MRQHSTRRLVTACTPLSLRINPFEPIFPLPCDPANCLQMQQLLRRWRGGQALALLLRAAPSAAEAVQPLGGALAEPGGAGPLLVVRSLQSAPCRWTVVSLWLGFAHPEVAQCHKPWPRLSLLPCCCVQSAGAAAGVGRLRPGQPPTPLAPRPLCSGGAGRRRQWQLQRRCSGWGRGSRRGCCVTPPG